MLRVTFIHPKACFPLPLVSGLYALGKGGLNLILQQYIYTRFSRGLSPVLARLEVGVRVGREAQAREVIRELYVQTRRQGAGTLCMFGIAGAGVSMPRATSSYWMDRSRVRAFAGIDCCSPRARSHPEQPRFIGILQVTIARQCP